MNKLILLFFLVCSGTLLNAQSQFSGWLGSFNTVKLGKKTSLHTDVQWRSTDKLKHTQTFLFRPGLNVHVNSRLIISAGYAYIHNRRVISNVVGFTPEHRIWEQLIYNHKISKIAVSHRFRLEQRFIGQTKVANNELENDGSIYANRFRYFIRNILPLQKGVSFVKGPFAALQNEVFLNFGNTSNLNGQVFDQNRLYLAAGYRLNPAFDLEAGYMYQYVKGRGDVHLNNNIVQVAGYLRL